jgi:hypothetical protein
MHETSRLKQPFVCSVTAEVSQLSLWLTGGGRLYGLLDACDESRILHIVAGLGDQAVSLYHGKSERDFFAIAPYLVELDQKLAETMVTELAETPWGYFVLAPQGCQLTTLRRHFRRFLTVKGPDGMELYFRFYDPRVIKTFLESSTAAEVVEFFGPVNQFAIVRDLKLDLIKPTITSTTENN